MKQITFFIILFCLGNSMCSQAQKSNIILSIEGAPSVRWLTGNTTLKEFNDPTLGFYGGLTAQLPFTKTWSLVTGIGFERKGSVAPIQATDFNGLIIGKSNSYFNHDYLTVPVLVRASFGNKIRYFFNAGVYYGYLLAAKFKIPANSFQSGIFNEDIKSIMNNHDLGVSIGGGIRIKIAEKWAIPIEIRSNHGLINTSKTPVVNNGSIKNNATNLIVGVAYAFD